MKPKNIALAACLTELKGTAPSEIQLTLDGTFRAKDGRPHNLDGWVINAEIAAKIIEKANSIHEKFCIDFDHSTLHTQKTGAKAPAAGWYKNLEYREGLGIFATDVEWTESASLSIQEKEYRYISPVLQFDPKTGAVLQIIMASAVNIPALSGMKDLTALATEYFSTQQDSQMEEIDKLKARIAELEGQLAEAKKTAACAVETPVVDLSLHVPVDAVIELQKEIAALNTRINQNAVDDLVKVGLSDGRITPALADWAKSLPHEALSAFLDKATPIAALSNMQTGDKPPVDEPVAQLSSEEIAVCSAMNLTHEQFIATKGAK